MATVQVENVRKRFLDAIGELRKRAKRKNATVIAIRHPRIDYVTKGIHVVG
jgi:hypothetical protein